MGGRWGRGETHHVGVGWKVKRDVGMLLWPLYLQRRDETGPVREEMTDERR